MCTRATDLPVGIRYHVLKQYLVGHSTAYAPQSKLWTQREWINVIRTGSGWEAGIAWMVYSRWSAPFGEMGRRGGVEAKVLSFPIGYVS